LAGAVAGEGAAQAVDGRRRLVVDLTPGEMERAPSGVVELLVPGQLCARTIAALLLIFQRAVGLRDRPVRLPAEIHSADEPMRPADVYLQVRRRQPELGKPDPGHGLKRGLGAAVGEVEHLARPDDAPPLRAVLEDDGELDLDRGVPVQCGVRRHDAFHEPGRPRDVHDRPGDSCDGYAERGGDVIAGQLRRADERAAYQRATRFLCTSREGDRWDGDSRR
jgi:hypothetical protein